MSSITTDEEQDWRQVLKSACADIVCEEADTFRKQDTAGVIFDRRYLLHRRRTIRESKRGGAYRAYAILSRVAIFVFVIFAASGVTAIGVSAVRNINWTAVMDWQEDHVDVSFAPDMETQNTTGGHEALLPSFFPSAAPGVETIQKPDEIQRYLEPTDLPMNIQKKVLYQDSTKYAVGYYLEGEYYCSYLLNVLHGSIKLDVENAIVTEVNINGDTAYLFQYDSNIQKTIQIIWTDGEYEYYLHTNDDRMSVETLLKIARSIR